MTAITASDIDPRGPGPEHSRSPEAPLPLRLGCVSYLNTLPLIEGLGKLAGVRLTLTAPARLTDLMLEDRIDLGLMSVIDFQNAPEEAGLAMLTCGMIGCDGPTLTVRVFSRVPFEKVGTLSADVDSHTSVALARVLLAEQFGTRPVVTAFDADAHRTARETGDAGGWPEAVLLIGDKVVTDAPPSDLYPFQMDLGEAWKDLTGLPFVYAVWMCREGTRNDARLPGVTAALDRQRRHNAGRLSWIISQRAALRGWPAPLASTYVRSHLRYDLTPAHRAGVDRFFDLAHAHGVIARRRATRWIEIA